MGESLHIRTTKAFNLLALSAIERGRKSPDRSSAAKHQRFARIVRREGITLFKAHNLDSFGSASETFLTVILVFLSTKRNRWAEFRLPLALFVEKVETLSRCCSALYESRCTNDHVKKQPKRSSEGEEGRTTLDEKISRPGLPLRCLRHSSCAGEGA